MKRSFIFALCLFGVVLRASVQTPTPPPATGSIEGAVVKEPGSQPLKKVLVQVIAEDQKQGGNYTATTDADGRFRIENVQHGRYRLYLERTGFVEINGHGRKSESNVFSVQPGQSLKDLLFRMLPTAIITGRVVDEDGDPMSGVTVFAQRKKPGKMRRETSGTERTNDLGEYRFSGLFPGQYWIVAMPPPDFRDYERKPEKSPEGDNQPDTRYLTTYYPGTYDGTQAPAVTLRAGDEMPVSLTLVPARTYRVRGIVTGVAPSQKPVVELVSKVNGPALRAAEVGEDGQFEVRGVGPGTYVARASAGTESQILTARQDVTVVAADVEGIKLTPMPSFTLSGHLRIEGKPSGDITQYTVNLRLAEVPEDPGFFMSQDLFGANAPVDRFGNFEWKNANPGNYIVQLYGGDGQDTFLKSVKLGERSADTGFTVSGPAAVELLVGSKAGVVEGAVLDSDRPVANATVVAVPEEKYRKLHGHFGIASTDQNGLFTIRGLAPGSYSVFAWQDVEDSLYYDADFLRSQEANATALKVEEGSRQKIELKLSPVSDEWQ